MSVLALPTTRLPQTIPMAKPEVLLLLGRSSRAAAAAWWQQRADVMALMSRDGPVRMLIAGQVSLEVAPASVTPCCAAANDSPQHLQHCWCGGLCCASAANKILVAVLLPYRRHICCRRSGCRQPQPRLLASGRSKARPT